jgi:hypothetical protein
VQVKEDAVVGGQVCMQSSLHGDTYKLVVDFLSMTTATHYKLRKRGPPPHPEVTTRVLGEVRLYPYTLPIPVAEALNSFMHKRTRAG